MKQSVSIMDRASQSSAYHSHNRYEPMLKMKSCTTQFFSLLKGDWIFTSGLQFSQIISLPVCFLGWGGGGGGVCLVFKKNEAKIYSQRNKSKDKTENQTLWRQKKKQQSNALSLKRMPHAKHDLKIRHNTVMLTALQLFALSPENPKYRLSMVH